ncbi:MAG TPA: histone deacetylase [Candidatus Kapabacteria bacterium]|jgi:acetoin utilization deacetylase AcuC-like enzyme|nr:histone deacetylase [Candidatus Kapabacteria bacterium]
MTVYYSDSYTVPLPPDHRFPMAKYRMLRDALLAEGVLDEADLHEAVPVDRDTLLLAHDAAYVDAFIDGTVDPAIVRRIGIPWSEAFVRRSLASTGGTLAAARAALREGIAGNLAGGTHHAFADRGEGYCVFNDIAVASLALLREGLVRRVGVVDLDVHQGNGTAAILGSDERVFTLSIHGRNNFPFTKVDSTLDVPVEDGIGDAEYLPLVEHALTRVLAFGPDIIFYQAGVDVLHTDALGRLRMTHDGVMARDRMVIDAALSLEIPIVLTLGGGYSKPIEETVRGHVGTYRAARAAMIGLGA